MPLCCAWVRTLAKAQLTRFCCAVAILCTTCAVLARNLQHGGPLRLLFTFGGVHVDPAALLLFAAMALWGAARGGGNVVLTSLADSTPTGVASVLSPKFLSRVILTRSISSCAGGDLWHRCYQKVVDPVGRESLRDALQQHGRALTAVQP